jgi:hypothetical protein
MEEREDEEGAAWLNAVSERLSAPDAMGLDHSGGVPAGIDPRRLSGRWARADANAAAQRRRRLGGADATASANAASATVSVAWAVANSTALRSPGKFSIGDESPRPSHSAIGHAPTAYDAPFTSFALLSPWSPVRPQFIYRWPLDAAVPLLDDWTTAPATDSPNATASATPADKEDSINTGANGSGGFDYSHERAAPSSREEFGWGAPEHSTNPGFLCLGGGVMSFAISGNGVIDLVGNHTDDVTCSVDGGRTWISGAAAHLPQPGFGSAMAYYQRKLYAFGGRSIAKHHGEFRAAAARGVKRTHRGTGWAFGATPVPAAAMPKMMSSRPLTPVVNATLRVTGQQWAAFFGLLTEPGQTPPASWPDRGQLARLHVEASAPVDNIVDEELTALRRRSRPTEAEFDYLIPEPDPESSSVSGRGLNTQWEFVSSLRAAPRNMTKFKDTVDLPWTVVELLLRGLMRPGGRGNFSPSKNSGSVPSFLFTSPRPVSNGGGGGGEPASSDAADTGSPSPSLTAAVDRRASLRVSAPGEMPGPTSTSAVRASRSPSTPPKFPSVSPTLSGSPTHTSTSMPTITPRLRETIGGDIARAFYREACFATVYRHIVQETIRRAALEDAGGQETPVPAPTPSGRPAIVLVRDLVPPLLPLSGAEARLLRTRLMHRLLITSQFGGEWRVHTDVPFQPGLFFSSALASQAAAVLYRGPEREFPRSALVFTTGWYENVLGMSLNAEMFVSIDPSNDAAWEMTSNRVPVDGISAPPLRPLVLDLTSKFWSQSAADMHWLYTFSPGVLAVISAGKLRISPNGGESFPLLAARFGPYAHATSSDSYQSAGFMLSAASMRDADGFSNVIMVSNTVRHSGSFRPCRGCGTGEYVSAWCSVSVHDAVCRTCSKCVPGVSCVSSPCVDGNGYYDVECVPCTPCGPGQKRIRGCDGGKEDSVCEVAFNELLESAKTRASVERTYLHMNSIYIVYLLIMSLMTLSFVLISIKGTRAALQVTARRASVSIKRSLAFAVNARYRERKTRRAIPQHEGAGPVPLARQEASIPSSLAVPPTATVSAGPDYAADSELMRDLLLTRRRAPGVNGLLVLPQFRAESMRERQGTPTGPVPLGGGPERRHVQTHLPLVHVAPAVRSSPLQSASQSQWSGTGDPALSLPQDTRDQELVLSPNASFLKLVEEGAVSGASGCDDLASLSTFMDSASTGPSSMSVTNPIAPTNLTRVHGHTHGKSGSNGRSEAEGRSKRQVVRFSFPFFAARQAMSPIQSSGPADKEQMWQSNFAAASAKLTSSQNLWRSILGLWYIYLSLAASTTMTFLLFSFRIALSVDSLIPRLDSTSLQAMTVYRLPLRSSSLFFVLRVLFCGGLCFNLFAAVLYLFLCPRRLDMRSYMLHIQSHKRVRAFVGVMSFCHSRSLQVLHSRLMGSVAFDAPVSPLGPFLLHISTFISTCFIELAMLGVAFFLFTTPNTGGAPLHPTIPVIATGAILFSVLGLITLGFSLLTNLPFMRSRPLGDVVILPDITETPMPDGKDTRKVDRKVQSSNEVL